MVLSVHKLSRPFKFPSRLDHHHLKPDDALSASLRAFRSKISDFITQICFKTEPGSDFRFNKCFDLINITNRAFAKMVVEIDYPMTRWGSKLTDKYLSYTLNLLDLLNSVNSSVSHLNHAKILIFHALSLIKNSPSSAAEHLKKIPITNLSKEFKLQKSIRIEERPGSEKERVVLQALDISRKIGFLVLGLVLSGLCSDAKPYMEIRRIAGGFDDSLIKDLDSRFCKEIQEKMEEVKQVNSATERLSMAISTGRYIEDVEELKTRLQVLENSIQEIEKKANNLFSEVLVTRNKLLDNLRLTGQST
ncbi:hypothetical protein DH2020_025838 [Rehmannia glutinosa]|uniref:Uncharacterized protein n=1 Tax=Rehmannia glutinosa TaxID=99300 RepID=A0ABR0W1D0_REHGL